MLGNGYSLLGEVSKYVAVSESRFTAVGLPSGGGVGISVTVVGMAGEVTELVYIAPDKKVHVQAVTVGTGGTWTGTLA